MHLFPQIGEENRGASYSLNVAYLAHYRNSALKDVIKYFTTSFASKFFSYFPPLKSRCILWSEKYSILVGGTEMCMNLVKSAVGGNRYVMCPL